MKKKIFSSPKTFFLLTKSFGCLRKSFRSRINENFEPCSKSEGQIVIELCHFSWDTFIFIKHKNCQKCVKIGCSKSWFPQKRSYLREYESYRPETGVKIFLRSIPKTFPLTSKRFSGYKKFFRRVKNFHPLFLSVYF